MQAARYVAGLSILVLTALVACSSGTPRSPGPTPQDGGHVGGNTGSSTATPSPSATATATPTPSPSPVPATASPSPTPGPISASPNPLVFSGSGQTLSFTVTDPGYAGQFLVDMNSNCGPDASIGSTTSTGPSAVFNVTAEIPSTNCTFEIQDSFGGTVVEQINIASGR